MKYCAKLGYGEIEKLKIHDGTPAAETMLTCSPAWLAFMKYCAKLGYGEIEKLKIHDGAPMVAERVTEKTKFG